MDARPGFAAAKVNLFLHVGVPAADGYHPVCSLMTFADVGDELTVQPAGDPAFKIDGPFANGLAEEWDNLVTRARDALMELDVRPSRAFSLHLTKNLPVAAGLGGGSADAAAALRLLCPLFGLEADDARVIRIARDLGSDVPACLASRPTLATGRGDDLEPAQPLPALHAVLVNPLIASPTGEVYRAYDEAPAPGGAKAPEGCRAIGSARDAAEFLKSCRNDLEAPAVRLRPRIGDVLGLLAAQSETLLARMSGSGATCFALCEHPAAASALAARISARERGWWVRRAVLFGSETE